MNDALVQTAPTAFIVRRFSTFATAPVRLRRSPPLPHTIPPIPIVPQERVRPRIIRPVPRPARRDVLAVAAVAVGAAGVVLAAQDRRAQREADDAGGQGVGVVVAVAVAAVLVAAPFALALGFPAALIDPAAVVVILAGTVIAGRAVAVGLGLRQGGRDRAP